MQLLLWLLAVIFGIPLKVEGDDYHNTSNWLETKILKGYDKTRRPVKDPNTSTLLKLMILIEHLEEIDEIAQTVSLHGWLEMRWNDEFLTWDRHEYGGLEKTYVNSWQIWQPKLIIDNSALGAHNWYEYSRWGRTSVRLSDTGKGSEVYRWPRFSFKFTCEMDFTDYPFDEQVCPIIIRVVVPMTQIEIANEKRAWLALSWTENPWNKERSISGWTVKSPVDQEIQYLNWRGNGVIRRPTNRTIARSTETWHRTILRFKRHAPYFGILIVLPAVVTSLMTTSVFLVSDKAHGVYVSIFSIIIQGLCMRDLLIKLPPCIGKLPNVVIFYGINLTLSFLSIFILIVFMNMTEFQRTVPFPFSLALHLGSRIPCLQWSGDSSVDYGKMEESEGVENVEVDHARPSTSSTKPDILKTEKHDMGDWEKTINVFSFILAVFYFTFYLLAIFSLFLGNVS